MNQIQQRLLVVSGRVQGVGFRFYTQQEATRRGITGFVRNLRDGTVEIVAQGESQALEAFIAWCHKGPPAAKVEQVTVQEQGATETFLGFEVRDGRA